MDVKLVEARIAVAAVELNLKIRLVPGDRTLADFARHTDAGTTPRPIRSAGGLSALLDSGAGLLAEGGFVGHAGILRRPTHEA